MSDELIDDLAHMNDLDLPWGFDWGAFLRERTQQARAVGEAAGTLKTIGSSQGGVVDVSSARQGRPKPRRSVRLKGARWMPCRSQEGGPIATPAQLQLPTPTKGTVRTPPRSCWGGPCTSSAPEDAPPRQYGGGPGVRANAWGVNLVSTGWSLRSGTRCLWQRTSGQSLGVSRRGHPGTRRTHWP